MEMAFLFILPAALWAHAWQMLGRYGSPRSLGVVGAGVGIILLALVALWRDAAIIVGSDNALSALVLTWAIYGGLLAAVAMRGYDQRTLGYYGLFLALVSVVFVLYYFLGDAVLSTQDASPTGFLGQGVGVISYIMGAYAAILAVLGGLLFLHLAIPMRALRLVAGWSFLLGALVSLGLATLVLLGMSLAAFEVV
jgi:hypothetical protein